LFAQQVLTVEAGTRVCLYIKYRQGERKLGFVCTASTDRESANRGLFIQQVQTVGAELGFVCIACTDSGS
jgi:hypothetical protein